VGTERKKTDELWVSVWIYSGWVGVGEETEARVPPKETADDFEPDGLESSSEMPWTAGAAVDVTSDGTTQGFDVVQWETPGLTLNVHDSGSAGRAVRGTCDEVAWDVARLVAAGEITTAMVEAGFSERVVSGLCEIIVHRRPDVSTSWAEDAEVTLAIAAVGVQRQKQEMLVPLEGEGDKD
jgi:hypothetical protein